MYANLKTIVRPSVAYRQSHEPIVQNNLAVTPADMMRMTELGKPISTQILGAEYYDGRDKLDFECNLEYRRGVDINDMWNAQHDGKDKVKKALATPNAMQSNPQSV